MSSVTRLPLRPREPSPELGPLAPSAQGDGLDPRRLLGGLRRRKVLIGGITFLGTAIAVLAVNQITPLYVAQSAVVLEGSHRNVVNIEAVSQGLTPDYYTNETQAAIIGSRHLASQAVDKLDLYRNKLFNPERAEPRESLLGLAQASFKRLLGVKPPEKTPSPWAGMSEAEKRRAMHEQMTDAYLGGLNVLPSTRSRVIAIEYTSSDPAFAARAANATAELYIADQQAAKGDANTQATAWLDRRVNELKEKVVEFRAQARPVPRQVRHRRGGRRQRAAGAARPAQRRSRRRAHQARRVRKRGSNRSSRCAPAAPTASIPPPRSSIRP